MSTESFEANLKRSNETRADIAENPGKYRMLSRDRPTGRLHLGHYFGSILNRVHMQDAGVDSLVLIADLQVITDRDTTEHIQDNVYNMVMDYLAAASTPRRPPSSRIRRCRPWNQLMLPFLSLVSEAELERNPTVKAEQEASGHELTGLLLTYPVHQACDILFCKSNIVPVGKDQLPHIEVTRQIARRFNKRYGRVFREPVGILSDAIEIPASTGARMSKSYGNSINAGRHARGDRQADQEEPHRLRARHHLRQGEPPRRGRPADHGGTHQRAHRGRHRGRDRRRRLRRAQGLRDRVRERLSGPPPRETRRLEQDLDYIKDVIHEGNRRANEIANETLGEVREAMGMVY